MFRRKEKNDSLPENTRGKEKKRRHWLKNEFEKKKLIADEAICILPEMENTIQNVHKKVPFWVGTTAGSLFCFFLS